MAWHDDEQADHSAVTLHAMVRGMKQSRGGGGQYATVASPIRRNPKGGGPPLDDPLGKPPEKEPEPEGPIGPDPGDRDPGVPGDPPGPTRD